MSVKDLRDAIEALDLEEEEVYLVLGYGRSVGTYPIHEDMAGELREIAVASLERIDRLDMGNYDGAAPLVVGEEGRWVPAERLNQQSPVFGMLREADELPEFGAAELEGKSLSFYAIGTGASVEDRTFFVKKNARQLHGKTRLFSVLRGALRPIRDEILSLERNVDFILRDEGAVVFETGAFERYVQDPADVVAELEENLDSLAAQLPFDKETIEMLNKVGAKGTILRRRVRSMVAGEHFENLDIPKVRAAFKSLRKSPGDYIKGGKLNFGADQAQFVMKVLDESAWVGPFSGEIFTTNAKRREA